MIHTVSELLSEMIAIELPKLDASEVVHAPTIGDMYEGLSGRLLELALPEGLGLRVVSGFIRGDAGGLSGQIDRMLVVGEGKRVPLTDSYLWHVKDVIAVLEVKKTLSKASLRDALGQLQAVPAIEKRYRASTQGQLTYDEVAPARRAFAEMTGRVAPSLGEDDSSSQFDRLLFRALIVEAASIIRVIIGWHGSKKERTLRQHVATYVQENVGTGRAGPTGLPQLVVSGDFSLVKANGQPFSPRIEGDEWPFYGSTSVNPLKLLLEFIWTRLDVRFGLGNVWGDDLRTEVLRALCVARAAERDGTVGWSTTIFSNTSTSSLNPDRSRLGGVIGV